MIMCCTKWSTVINSIYSGQLCFSYRMIVGPSKQTGAVAEPDNTKTPR